MSKRTLESHGVFLIPLLIDRMSALKASQTESEIVPTYSVISSIFGTLFLVQIKMRVAHVYLTKEV